MIHTKFFAFLYGRFVLKIIKYSATTEDGFVWLLTKLVIATANLD